MRFIELTTQSDTARAMVLGCAMGVCLAGPAVAQNVSDMARAELERRAADASEAQELLKQGDSAYKDEDYEQAAQAYNGAVELLPREVPAVATQRRAAVQRLAQASVEVARKHRRLGDLEAARAALDVVLNENVAPGNAAALAMRERLRDPIRTNPASTPEHTANVEEVRLLLYKAQGAYELGKFDEAMAVYEDVLRVDPTNAAARRGMERVALARSDYSRAAYDHTRAEMLSQVDGAWELPVPAAEDVSSMGRGGLGGQDEVSYLDKLEDIRIPVVSFDDVTLSEAVDFLRQRAADLDTSASDPVNRGINIVLDLGARDSEEAQRLRTQTFDMNLRDIPLGQVVDYITRTTGTVAVEQPFALVIRPAGMDSADMTVETYRVPPDFLSAATGESEQEEGTDDPFAQEDEDGGGLIARQLTAREVLENRGVQFPEGASASFNSSSSTLRVRNTVVNQAMVERIVDAVANAEPAAIVVEMKLLRTTQQDLEELSFDWVLGPFGFGPAEGGVPGRNEMFLGGGTNGNGGPINDVPVPSGTLFADPVTAGNRSGNAALSQSSIDEVVASRSRGSGSADTRAPGILSVNGLLNDTFVSVLMRGVDQSKAVDLMATPSVTTRSGQAASVRVIREFVYPTEYEPPELPNQVGTGDILIDLDTGMGLAEEIGLMPVTPSTPTSFEMRETGIVLDVLPTASADKRYVNLTIKPEFVEFDGFINYGTPILAGQTTQLASGGGGGFGSLFQQQDQVITPNEILMPVFSTIGTETSLTVADNTTIVIGGLLEETNESVEDRTPVLGDLPVVGRLFQSKVSRPVKTAIILLVKVRVVDAAGRPFNP